MTANPHVLELKGAIVFVTGGSGFLGGYLIRALCKRGARVKALARSKDAAAKVKAAGAEPVTGDLDDIPAMQMAMRGCDVVFHAAAYAKDWGPRDEFFKANVMGTQHVITAAMTSRVPRMVHIGTEAVLVGGEPIVNADETRPPPERSIGLYPLTKKLAEAAVLAANGADFSTVVVRPRLIWGAGDTTILPELVDAVEAGRFMWIDGGAYNTSTCHVTNVCEGTLLAAERGAAGGVYFLTDGEPMPMRRFMTAMLSTRNLTPRDKSLPRWLAGVLAATVQGIWRLLRLKRRPPITRTAVKLIGEEVTVNDARARTELGYQGRVTFEQGLAGMRSQ